MLGFAVGLPTLGLLTREFRYVPYGSKAPAGRQCISCDGKVPGTSLECTHWTNNETPEELYADTSTAIALNLARQRIEHGKFLEYDDALVVNNHYDTDGVLSVWACTDPEAALRHTDLLVAGAEAGDFGEWSSDLGVKLDCAVSSLCSDEDDEGYAAALAALPALIRDLESDQAGSEHEDLWRDGWTAALESWKRLESKEVKLSVHQEGRQRICLLEQPAGYPRVASAALHRGLREVEACGHAGPDKACTRVLRAEHDAALGMWRYELEKPGHGWVQRLVERTPVPAPTDADALVDSFNAHNDCAAWEAGGSSGLVALCRTPRWVEVPPAEVLRAIGEVDVRE